MKGGVVRRSINIPYTNGNYFHDDRHACQFFLENCTMQILSNSTISAITFKCTLNDGIDSPFVHVRSGLFNTPVRHLFIKCFPTWNSNTLKPNMLRVDRGRSGSGWGADGQIEIASIVDVSNEAQMQHQAYCASFNTPDNLCDPICPSILSMKFLPKNRRDLPQGQQTVEQLIEYIRGRLVARDGLGRREQPATIAGDLQEIRDTFFMNNPNIGISIIIMEMLEGYMTTDSYIYPQGNPRLQPNQNNYNRTMILAKFEFIRLANLGFRQKDIHPGNFMINPTYNYLKDYIGRVTLIDFGRVERIEPHQVNETITLINNVREFRGIEFDYNQATTYLQQKNDRIRQYLRNNSNINLDSLLDNLLGLLTTRRIIVGGTTNINNDNNDDNELVSQFLNNQPIDVVIKLLEIHKERMSKVDELIDNFKQDQLTISNDENMLTKKMNQNSIQNKTTKKQQSPLRNTIFNNFNHNLTRLMVAGKKSKPFSRTRKNKRT